MLHRLMGAAAVGTVLAAALVPTADAAKPAPNSKGVFTVPAGQTLTLSNATIAGCDPLTYGYKVTGSGKVAVGNNGAGDCGSDAAPDATVGPFDHNVKVKVYLLDSASPKYYFYSNNKLHAAQTGSNPYGIGICDSYFGSSSPKQPCEDGAPPDPQSSNLTVTLTIGTPTT